MTAIAEWRLFGTLPEVRSLDSAMKDHCLSANGLVKLLLMLADHVTYQMKDLNSHSWMDRPSRHAILD